MTWAKHMTAQSGMGGARLWLTAASVGFALRSCRFSISRTGPPPRSLAKPRRTVWGFGRLAAHSYRGALVSLPAAPRPASWGREQLSRIEGVYSCGQSSHHLRLGFAQGLLAVATPRASKLSLVRGQARLALCCWMPIQSLASPLASQETSFTAKKTPASAEGAVAASRLTRRPLWAAIDTHASAAGEPWARLRRFAFRHTKEQGTANV